MDQIVWGIDIGGTKCAFLQGKPSGEIISRKEVATKEYAHWEELLLALMPTPNEAKKPLAIGVSCGGPLDSKKGFILSPPNLPGWDEVPIVQWLENRYKVPAALQNDADAGAMAEWRFGSGKGCENMIFLTFGTGFGAGLILNGKLYSGTKGMAGEIGHVRAAEKGPVGYGKEGSFEGFCSGGGIAQLSGGRSAKEVVAAAEEGNHEMIKVLQESATYLGRAVALLIDLFNPERIVIGSIFARAEKWFRPTMEKVIAQEALPHARVLCQVLPAKLGDAIGDIAALSAAIDCIKG
ncbi:MAG: ROK family protein [Clostridiales bacterium]|nr:ROK family protein [Clostridiales bacterium]